MDNSWNFILKLEAHSIISTLHEVDPNFLKNLIIYIFIL